LHNVIHAGQAVRIMTGAPVPEGADSVQQVELTREDGACVEILQTVAEGRSIVRRGSEISAGETVLRAGERISAGSIATLASFGYHSVQVGRQPRVAVLATGSELVPVDRQPAQDQIRDSNNYSIEAYAKLAGAVVERLPLTADQNEDLKTVIAGAASHSDVVITSGGVSMGVYDFTKTAFRELGAEIYFERVALRPGKPTVFGKLPNGTLLFGLPGNPVSVSVTFLLFTQCCLLALQGAAESELHHEWALLDGSVKSSPDRDSYLPATLTTNEHAQQIAVPLKWGGSSDFVSFARATALIVIPARSAAVQGTHVKVIRLA
jgi:molybdenum cofactor synthesis domain-containing protein